MPVLVDDSGKIYHAKMLAGSVGVVVTSSGEMLDLSEQHEQRYWQEGAWEPLPCVAGPPTGESGLDTIQSLSGWWISQVESPEEAEDQSRTQAKHSGVQSGAVLKSILGY